MSFKKPSKIEEYYIGYFDVLGYKQFFKDHPNDVASFLTDIHAGIEKSYRNISFYQQSKIIRDVAGIDVGIKVFSDNILFYLKAGDIPQIERVKLISFLLMMCDTQRNFINTYDLFVRGSVVKGTLSVNEHFIFGQGLIDAVAAEEEATVPRITISEELITMIEDNSCFSDKKFMKEFELLASKINDKSQFATDQEINLFQENKLLIRQENYIRSVFDHCIFKGKDGELSLNYLCSITPGDFLPKSALPQLEKLLRANFPNESEALCRNLYAENQTEQIIRKHKDKLIRRLRTSGNYDGVSLKNPKEVDLRRTLIQKYAWVLAYHNTICKENGFEKYAINYHIGSNPIYGGAEIKLVEDEFDCINLTKKFVEYKDWVESHANKLFLK